MSLCLRAGFLVMFVATLGACRSEQAGTATITAGVPQPIATEPEPASWRLSNELCKRRASCLVGGPGGSSTGATATAECVQAEQPRLRAMLDAWDCPPAAQRARLEECVASLRVERCEPIVGSSGPLPICRANDACGPHMQGAPAP